MNIVGWFDHRVASLPLLAGLCLLLAAAPAAGAGKILEGVVNINAATAVELQLLPGVGPAKADLIVAYRRLHPFRSIEELARVKGIGPKTVRKLKPHLSIRGETTARVSPAKPAPAP
jgi:competence protein ComEA